MCDLTRPGSGFMHPDSPMGKPKIACLISHVRVWEQLVSACSCGLVALKSTGGLSGHCAAAAARRVLVTGLASA